MPFVYDKALTSLVKAILEAEDREYLPVLKLSSETQEFEPFAARYGDAEGEPGISFKEQDGTEKCIGGFLDKLGDRQKNCQRVPTRKQYLFVKSTENIQIIHDALLEQYTEGAAYLVRSFAKKQKQLDDDSLADGHASATASQTTAMTASGDSQDTPMPVESAWFQQALLEVNKENVALHALIKEHPVEIVFRQSMGKKDFHQVVLISENKAVLNAACAFMRPYMGSRMPQVSRSKEVGEQHPDFFRVKLQRGPKGQDTPLHSFAKMIGAIMPVIYRELLKPMRMPVLAVRVRASSTASMVHDQGGAGKDSAVRETDVSGRRALSAEGPTRTRPTIQGGDGHEKDALLAKNEETSGDADDEGCCYRNCSVM